MAAPAYKLTSWAEVQTLYSTRATGIATGDLAGAELASFQTWVIDYSTEECLLFIGTRYKNLQDLATSNIVRMWATILGCYRVTSRRGNPELFNIARDEVVTYLKQVQRGELSLPDVDANSSNVPSMHNYTYDPRFMVNGIRVAHDGVSYSGGPNDKPRYPVFPVQ